MAVQSSDLQLRLTTNNLGGAITGTALTTGNLFDAFTGDETTAGRTEYACLYFRNDAAQTALSARIYINSETSHAGTNVSIGLGSSSVNGTEQTVANATTAPTSVTFSEANGSGNALNIGDIPAGQHKAVWVRIVIDPGTAAVNNYSVQYGLACDTAA